MSATPLLEVMDLSVAIGSARIVKNVSLEVRAGEILGLVGASGSGKSMTALSIMRLLPASASFTARTRKPRRIFLRSRRKRSSAPFN